MPEYKGYKPCADCGRMTRYRNRKGRCWECSRAAMKASIVQIATKDGPFYEEYKKGMRRNARKLKKGKEQGRS